MMVMVVVMMIILTIMWFNLFISHLKICIFFIVYPQHHCRKCGGVVCGACSTKRFLLPQQSSKPLRICDKCYSQLTNEEKSRDIAKPAPESGALLFHINLLCHEELCAILLCLKPSECCFLIMKDFCF